MFRELLAEKVPRVSTYLESHLVDVSQVSVIWFPVIFVELLPSDILLPLWDAFLYEGSKVRVCVCAHAYMCVSVCACLYVYLGKGRGCVKLTNCVLHRRTVGSLSH